jgi:hypothetical protein
VVFQPTGDRIVSARTSMTHEAIERALPNPSPSQLMTDNRENRNWVEVSGLYDLGTFTFDVFAVIERHNPQGVSRERAPMA